jgi:uncharacterized cupredoxin-like copper-binding protein
MRRYAGFFVRVACVLLVCGRAFADTGHDHADMKTTFGHPGSAAAVTRIINVEATDRMRYVFDRTDIRRGDVVKFVIRNAGKTRHEFSIGDAKYQRAHAAMMKKMPGMVHDDSPNMTTLEPGATKTLIWKFDQPVKGGLIFACHEPGHFEAGMKMGVALKK